MIKLKWLVLIMILLIAPAGYSQIRDKDIMIKRIFEVLKNKDEDGFVKLFPDINVMKNMLEEMIRADTSEMSGEMMKKVFEEMTDSSIQKEFRDDFKSCIKKGENKGVDWSRADLVSYTADSSIVKEVGLDATMLRGKIYFKADQKDFFIAYSEVIWLEDKGWYGVSIRRIDEKTKENDAYEYEDAYTAPGEDSLIRMIDSTRIIDSLEAAKDADGRKPAQSQKQPVKSKPVKKTQTPARKPE